MTHITSYTTSTSYDLLDATSRTSHCITVHVTLADQGNNLGDLFVDVAAISNIKVESTGIEAHGTLGIGERYHQSLRSYKNR